jgi:hypothetical protein
MKDIVTVTYDTSWDYEVEGTLDVKETIDAEARDILP